MYKLHYDNFLINEHDDDEHDDDGWMEAPGRIRGSAGHCARRREDPSQMTSVLAALKHICTAEHSTYVSKTHTHTQT